MFKKAFLKKMESIEESLNSKNKKKKLNPINKNSKLTSNMKKTSNTPKKLFALNISDEEKNNTIKNNNNVPLTANSRKRNTKSVNQHKIIAKDKIRNST